MVEWEPGYNWSAHHHAVISETMNCMKQAYSAAITDLSSKSSLFCYQYKMKIASCDTYVYWQYYSSRNIADSRLLTM